MACERSDVEKVYGKENILSWADLDGSGDSKVIEDRITWACGKAERTFNARLRGGPYTIPVESYTADVIDIIALQAGIILYDGRRIVGATDAQDQVSPQRREVDDIYRMIRAGQYQLDSSLTRTLNYPVVVVDANPLYEEN